MSAHSEMALWERLVGADAAYAEALAAIPLEVLPTLVGKGLGSLGSRRAALRILRSADWELVQQVAPALYPLLLVSHSLLAECRRVLLRLPPQELEVHLSELVRFVTGSPRSDLESYRRLGELLRLGGARDLLAELVRDASNSGDPEIREFAEDFSN